MFSCWVYLTLGYSKNLLRGTATQNKRINKGKQDFILRQSCSGRYEHSQNDNYRLVKQNVLGKHKKLQKGAAVSELQCACPGWGKAFKECVCS